MARFTLQIDCDNEAFHAPEDGRADPGREIARILRKTADKVEDHSIEGNLRDGNGNRVGEYKYTSRASRKGRQ